MSKNEYADREPISVADIKVITDILAEKGITVRSDYKLDQDPSISFYPEDGHFYDFGRGGIPYRDVHHLLNFRPDLVGAPAQARTIGKRTKPITQNTDRLTKQAQFFHRELEEFYDLEEPTLQRKLDDLLPSDWFKSGFPRCIGYRANEPKTLTVSALDGDIAQAVCFRRDKTKEGKEVKWKTFGSKTFIPSKLTGKDDVYLASGMGELVLLEQLGVDYICLQMDGAVKHLTEPTTKIKHLIILPDNDKTFMGIIPDILTALNPKKASIVEWEHADPREAAMKLGTMEVFMSAVADNLVELEMPEEKGKPRTKIIEFDLDSAPDIVKSFNTHWEDNLCNISSPALQANWKQNFDAFDEIILRNRKDRPGKKICCPSSTGSGKTQQITHKAISLYKSKIGTLIVVMRNADADIIASQIKAATHDDYVAVFHTSEVTVPGVRKAENPDDAQCLIISHERFRRQEKTITNKRDFIVIDEAINVIRQNEMEEVSLRNILKIIDRYGKSSNKRLMSEKRMIESILEQTFDVFRETGKAFSPYRDVSAAKKLNYLYELEFHAVAKMIQEPRTRISPILTEGYFNQKMDNALKSKYSALANNLKYFFRQFAFFTRAGSAITLTTASELIPKKSIVIMDATASVNEAYALYMEYQPKKLEVLDAIDCRDYKNVNLHTVRAATGRSTIIGSDEKKTSARIKELFNNIILNSEPDDEILLVSFLKLEAEMMTYAEGITDRKIHVDHWGNLTGTNKYQYCRRIFIYGLNHKRESVHRSVHALAKSAVKSFEDTDENKLEMKSLVTSDLVAEVIQAINRIRCRRVIDTDGNCDVADVYLTLPAGFSDASIMLSAIKSEMTNIKIDVWDIEKEDAVNLARVYSIESFMRQLEISLSGNTVEISVGDVLDQLSMTKKQYSDYIKNKPAFKAAIEQSDFYIEMRHRTGYRGKVMKTKEPWFCVGV